MGGYCGRTTGVFRWKFVAEVCRLVGDDQGGCDIVSGDDDDDKIGQIRERVNKHQRMARKSIPNR